MVSASSAIFCRLFRPSSTTKFYRKNRMNRWLPQKKDMTNAVTFSCMVSKNSNANMYPSRSCPRLENWNTNPRVRIAKHRHKHRHNSSKNGQMRRVSARETVAAPAIALRRLRACHDENLFSLFPKIRGKQVNVKKRAGWVSLRQIRTFLVAPSFLHELRLRDVGKINN